MEPILSDEEIEAIADRYSDEFGHIVPDNWIAFALAIITAQRKKEERQ